MVPLQCVPLRRALSVTKAKATNIRGLKPVHDKTKTQIEASHEKVGNL
jgi:hypothetical protein